MLLLRPSALRVIAKKGLNQSSMKAEEAKQDQLQKEKKPSNYLDDLPIEIGPEKIRFTQEEIIQIIKEEYFYLQSTVDKYDDKAITIKSWSISFSIVVLGSGLVGSNKHLFLLACLSSILFWIMETYWKVFQKSFYGRIYDIEKFLNGKKMKKFRLVNTTGSFNFNLKKNLSSSSNWFKVMFSPQVMLPHFVITCISMVAWIYQMLHS